MPFCPSLDMTFQRVSCQTIASLEQKLLIIFPSILLLIKPIKVIKEYIEDFEIKYYVC
jgi:hypothetical protein